MRTEGGVRATASALQGGMGPAGQAALGWSLSGRNGQSSFERRVVWPRDSIIRLSTLRRPYAGRTTPAETALAIGTDKAPEYLWRVMARTPVVAGCPDGERRTRESWRR